MYCSNGVAAVSFARTEQKKFCFLKLVNYFIMSFIIRLPIATGNNKLKRLGTTCTWVVVVLNKMLMNIDLGRSYTKNVLEIFDFLTPMYDVVTFRRYHHKIGK